MVDTCPDCHGDLRYTVEVIDIYQDEPEIREVECASCMARVTAEMWETVNAELHHAANVETPAEFAARQASWEAADKDLEDARRFRQVLWLLVVAVSVGTFLVWAVTR